MGTTDNQEVTHPLTHPRNFVRTRQQQRARFLQSEALLDQSTLATWSAFQPPQWLQRLRTWRYP